MNASTLPTRTSRDILKLLRDWAGDMNELRQPEDLVVASAAQAENYGRHMATGSVLSGLVRLGVIPLGVIAAVFLARELGPGDFGVFAVASSIVWWAQQTLNAFFNRTSIKLVAETAEWQ